MSEKISVVIPVYGCRAALEPLHQRLVKTLLGMGLDYEIILVNDACPQNSWESIVQICKEDERVVGLDLSRNFGQIKAITAGLDACTGDYVVVMDCDLQDRPEAIADLYAKLQEGYDIVFARRQERKDGFFTKLLSKCFYKVYNHFSDGNYDASICNFNISRRVVIENYCKMREQNRGYTIFLKWLGFKSVAIDIPHDARAEGKSSYNMRKKIKMATAFITAQSNKPLKYALYLGVALLLCVLGIAVFGIVRHYTRGFVSVEYLVLLASVYLVGGVLLLCIGLLGVYLGTVFNEMKKRPLYAVREALNYNEKEGSHQ